MVDAERLRRILQRVSDDVTRLRSYATSRENGLLDDEARLGHVKYLFVTAIEGCISAAHHICSSEGWRPPNTNADAMRVLAEHDLIDRELGRSMARAVGFRNVLVHEYTAVDDQRVLAALESLGDIEQLIAAMAGLIEN